MHRGEPFQNKQETSEMSISRDHAPQPYSEIHEQDQIVRIHSEAKMNMRHRREMERHYLDPRSGYEMAQPREHYRYAYPPPPPPYYDPEYDYRIMK